LTATVSNRQIRIGFKIPQPSYVVLEIYDAAGRQKATLVDKFLSEGWHAAIWNATASAGIYFCRLKAGESEEKQKLVLIGR